MQGERQERRFMGPILEKPPLPPASPGCCIDQGPVVRPEARESGQVVGSDEDIDTIDLMEGEPVDRLAPLPGRDLARPPRAEALGRKGDAPRFGWRKLLHAIVTFGGLRWAFSGVRPLPFVIPLVLQVDRLAIGRGLAAQRMAATCHSEPPVERSGGESNGSLFDKVKSKARNSWGIAVIILATIDHKCRLWFSFGVRCRSAPLPPGRSMVGG
jgi:hypothetical protein